MVKAFKYSSRRNSSIFYTIALAIILLGYFLFFNSKSFMPDTSTIFYTPYDKVSYIGSSKVKISRWEYNKNKDYMEVELRYEETDDQVLSKFNFSAKPRCNQSIRLPVKTIIYTDDTYILHIENIPKNYGAIALKLTQSSTSGTTVASYDIDSDDDFSEMPTNDKSTDTITLYTDYRKVKVNNNLKVETEKQYLYDLTKREINDNYTKISKLDNAISTNKNLISVYQDKIVDLKSQLKYEIPEDQNKTDEKVSDFNNRIENCVMENSDMDNQKIALKEKISKLKIKLNDLKK